MSKGSHGQDVGFQKDSKKPHPMKLRCLKPRNKDVFRLKISVSKRRGWAVDFTQEKDEFMGIVPLYIPAK